MASAADRDAVKGVNEAYQYVVGDEAFHFRVGDGAVELHHGWADDPAVTVTTYEGTWTDIVDGKLSASAAADQGAVEVTGDHRARERLAAIFARTHVLTPT
jgi:putative sterol carrier protein